MKHNDWKPINTYPHETRPWHDRIGERVLLANDVEIVTGYPMYHHDDDGVPFFYDWTSGDGWVFVATHWMPLPSLPPPADQEKPHGK